MYGDVDGFVQIPAGGEPGSTSPRRPTLDELGIDNGSVYDIAGAAQKDRHIINLGARLTTLDGSGTLTQDLTSQNQFYPAGTQVESDIQLNWYRLGYLYEIPLAPAQNGSQVFLSPGLQAVLLDFDYELKGDGGQRSKRGFTKGGVRVGGTARWQTSEKFSLEGLAYLGVDLGSTANISSFEIVGRYSFSKLFSAFGGVAWDRIEFEDSQTVPNRIDIDFGPMAVVGIRFDF